MFANTIAKRLVLISLFISTILVNLPVHAKPEYMIGLTAQGIRNATAEEIEIGFNYQLNIISKDKDYDMRIKIFPNLEQLSNALSSNKIIGYFGTPLFYLQNKDTFDPNVIYTPVLSEKMMQHYLLLVRKDSAIDKFEKLKNTNLSYCETDEVGTFYLQKLSNDRKTGQLSSFFSKMVVKKNPSLAISSVFFKETQATIVLESDYLVAVELNPQLKKQLIAIETSPEYITNILVITNKLEGPLTGAEYETHVAALGSAIRSKTLLKSYNYGSLRKIKPEDLNSVTDLINSLNKNKYSSK